MKKKIDVARAWRDQDYFLTLSEEERAELGAHPAGALSLLEDSVLKSITGGCGSADTHVYGPCDTSGTAVCTPCPPADCM